MSGITSTRRKPTTNGNAGCTPRGEGKPLPKPDSEASSLMNSYHLDHLQYLETEAIHIMREVAAEFERPALLFSGGKDSICLLRLAEKAFRPSDIPMPIVNIDTANNFTELNEFRDRRAKPLGGKIIVR